MVKECSTCWNICQKVLDTNSKEYYDADEYDKLCCNEWGKETQFCCPDCQKNDIKNQKPCFVCEKATNKVCCNHHGDRPVCKQCFDKGEFNCQEIRDIWKEANCTCEEVGTEECLVHKSYRLRSVLGGLMYASKY